MRIGEVSTLVVALLLIGQALALASRLEADTPIVHEVEKLLASDGTAGDNLGLSVDVEGETVAVGSRLDDELGVDSGAAYVFERDEHGTWREIELLPSDGAAEDRFGVRVALSGSSVVVGAHLDDDSGSASGSAYVFQRDPAQGWKEVAKLVASDGASKDYFGVSVAISDRTVVIGATGNDDLGSDSGSAYIFERDATGSWREAARLLLPDAEHGDEFGNAVQVSGDTVVVASRDHADGRGAVYVFERDAAGNWSGTFELSASDGAAYDSFGWGLSLAGDRLAVGAPGDDDLVPNSGSAYVFERDVTGAWTEVAKLLGSEPGEHDNFGDSVALSGDRLVVGAFRDDDLGQDSGSAYLFERDGTGGWTEVARLLASDGAKGDFLGRPVAMSGERIVAGAHEDDDLGADSGAAYVFSGEDCTLKVGLDRHLVRAGDALQVALFLEHNAVRSVTVPFAVWIEDERGRVVTGTETAPRTFRHGDTLRRRVAVEIPAALAPGWYVVAVGVEQMQQGVAVASERFRVVEAVQ